MTAQQMDAVSSFQHVVDNIPTWKTTVAELATYAAKKHEEYAAEYARLLHLAKPKKKKSESISSIRSVDEQTDEPLLARLDTTIPKPLDLVGISPFEAGNRYLYAQAHRKRKPGTSMRSGASDSSISRSKQSVVIYYDAHIQAELDTLVKAFGIARNNLRKGKNAYTAANGFQLPNLLRRYGGLDSNPSKTFLRDGPRIGKQQNDVTAATQTGASDMGATFATTDKEIEVIQGFCERAAHQAIRNGDCKLELESTLRNMDQLLISAETTLTKLKAEFAQQSQEKPQGSPDGLLAAVPNNRTRAEAHIPSSKAMAPVLESLEAAKRPPVLPATSPLALPTSPTAANAIEVDEDEDYEEDDALDFQFDMSRLRSTRIIA